MLEPSYKQKILLVDDHLMFIDGIKTIINKTTGYEIVGDFTSGYAAFEFMKDKQVDILITDINMPEMSGIELTRLVKETKPEVKILVLSMYDDREIIHDIILAEAEGYILKNAGKQELLRALEKISNGGTYYSNEVMQIITENYVARHKVIERTKDLTSRENEILQLVCQEYSTPEIAKMLNISPLTVETHRKNILRKTKTRTIVGLIRFAIENGLA